jgi:hypothetical protein
MKEVPRKDLPDVSGGEYDPGDGCIPDPMPKFPTHIDLDYPRLPIVENPDVQS